MKTATLDKWTDLLGKVAANVDDNPATVREYHLALLTAVEAVAKEAMAEVLADALVRADREKAAS